MGSEESAPDRNLLPVQAGTIPEGMASLHKNWESINLRWAGLGWIWPGIKVEN